MPPPRRKHPVRKPPPPKPTSAARGSPAAPTSTTPSAQAIREANEAAELQNAVMAEQIMKSDAPQAVKNFVTRPDYKVDIKAWNDVYEAYLAHLWGPNSTTKRIDLQKVQEYDSWVSGAAILNRENKRRNVRDYASKLAQIVLHSELKHDSLLDRWRKLSTDEREAQFFASMKTMTDNGNEASQTRNEVPEITLAEMTGGGGEGFIRLINHFADNYKKSLTDPSHDVYQPLENEVYERIYMLDRSEDAPPLPKGIRAFQEEMLLDRHLYMILFLIGILLRLNGVQMKFTQPAKGDEEDSEEVQEEGTTSRDDPVAALDVEKKLSLRDSDQSRAGSAAADTRDRPTMSNVRQYPLTAGLLRQLSDFTSDTFYHVYYTSPSTGDERKQPLQFTSNPEAIKSFLPIRNAAIQARDDRACGLLCAILIEGCVDDYAGGEVTEEMVANQMKRDFEWTDEQLNELVPPEYVLVQLDVVPDLPEVVQKAEESTTGRTTSSSSSLEKEAERTDPEGEGEGGRRTGGCNSTKGCHHKH